MSTNAKWQFPPRNGGIDVVQDSSSAHFSDDPIPKLVREIIQNSLDARESGISDPVVVKFADTEVKRELIGASQLCKHLTACLERAKREKMPQDVRKVYENARNALKIPRIRCLRITDSGTTGLSDSNWDALVVREGDVRKSNAGAPGGSYGIGKNAVFNVSDAQTVFYSTRYVNGKEGRVEKMQGKATLMAHQDPATGKDLQHIGFYRASNGDPFITTDIPDFFRLEETGTGVFIMGFNPLSSDWVDAVTSAVIENFFYAIHHKQLIVEISSGSKNERVTHETIDQMFEARSSRKPNTYHHYYLAIRDEEAVSTQEIDKVGVLDVHIVLAESAPRRTAYVNRNGMLITDSKEQKSNPMAPRAKSLWPDYAVVVSPSTDKGDAWVRTMENPSHDSVSSGQLPDDKERRHAERVFERARQAIREIIDKRADIERYGDTSNLEELAKYFPELDPKAQGNRKLRVDVVTTTISQHSSHDIDDDGTDIGKSNDVEEGGSIEQGKSNGGATEGKQDNDSVADEGDKPSLQSKGNEANPRSRPKISKTRVIPTGVTEAIIAFDPTSEELDEIKLRITPAGGERDKEDPIRIIDATVHSPDTQEVTIKDGVLSLVPDTNERIQLKIVTDAEIRGYALKMRLMK